MTRVSPADVRLLQRMLDAARDASAICTCPACSAETADALSRILAVVEEMAK